MIKVGNIVVGPTNNFLKMHGISMNSHKRYPHERKWLTKRARIKYHAMKRAGCDDELIYRYMARDYGDGIAEKIVYGKRGRQK